MFLEGEIKMKEKCCDVKTKAREKSEKEMLISHLNRINGQINGIKQMVEESRYCDDILMQITAATNSLKSLGLTVMEKHMKTCVKDKIKNGDDEVIDEVMKTFERLCR